MKNKTLLLGAVAAVAAPVLAARPVAIFGRTATQFLQENFNFSVVIFPVLTRRFILESWVVEKLLYAFAVGVVIASIVIIRSKRDEQQKLSLMLRLVVFSMGTTLVVFMCVFLAFYLRAIVTFQENIPGGH